MFSVRTPFFRCNFFCESSQNYFQHVQKNIWKKFILKAYVSIIFWHSVNFFFHSAKTFSVGLSKLHFTCSEVKFKGKGTAIEKKSCQYLLSIELECLPFLAKRFQQNSQNSILSAHIYFVRKNFVVNKKREKYHGEMSKTVVTNKDIQRRSFWCFRKSPASKNYA